MVLRVISQRISGRYTIVYEVVCIKVVEQRNQICMVNLHDNRLGDTKYDAYSPETQLVP